MWSLNRDRCTSCEECVKICPLQSLEMHEGFPHLLSGMPPAEKSEFPLIHGLHAQRHPRYSRRRESFRCPAGNCTGIGFYRYLGVSCNFRCREYLRDMLMQQYRSSPAKIYGIIASAVMPQIPHGCARVTPRLFPAVPHRVEVAVRAFRQAERDVDIQPDVTSHRQA